MTVLDARAIVRMPAGPDKVEAMAFRAFLRHHAPAKPCDCGVPMVKVDGVIASQPSPGCDCPCHVDGWVTGKRPPR